MIKQGRKRPYLRSKRRKKIKREGREREKEERERKIDREKEGIIEVKREEKR